MAIPQQTVYGDLPPGVEGDFASANPRGSMLAGEAAFKASAAGVILGRFAWARIDNGLVSNAHPGVAARYGFVHRNQPGVILTLYLGQSIFSASPGTPVTLFDNGDFLARFAAGGTPGQKVYLDYGTGLATAAATGAATTNALIVANTTSGSANLVVTANTGSPIYPGQPVSGAGIPAGTFIVSGPAAGGAGTYVMSANATATATGVTVTSTTTFETRWFLDGPPNGANAGGLLAAGDLGMISTRS